jgi:hypothetical protein
MAKGPFRNINFRNINLRQRGKRAVMPVQKNAPKRWQIELKKAGATRKPFKSN